MDQATKAELQKVIEARLDEAGQDYAVESVVERKPGQLFAYTVHRPSGERGQAVFSAEDLFRA